MENEIDFQDFGDLSGEIKEELQIIVLFGGTILISKISQVISELGEPDCKLNNPYRIINSGEQMVPWMEEYTDDTEFMISSDKILTLAEPNSKLSENYLQLIK